MPKTEVLFFAAGDGSSPVLEWVDKLPEKVQNKLMVRIERLSEYGHEMRRPMSDYLGDDIHELRAAPQRSQLSHLVLLP